MSITKTISSDADHQDNYLDTLVLFRTFVLMIMDEQTILHLVPIFTTGGGGDAAFDYLI